MALSHLSLYFAYTPASSSLPTPCTSTVNRYWVWEAGQVPWQSGKWYGPWGQSKSWLEYILMNKLKSFRGSKMGLVGVTNSIRGL